ncbi:MAG: hypothetical protein EBU46_00635 [Nitrosomonadaceae bacterium]|nr:hypothetical protein [Nitrosomonadaceae bacterium]
MQKSYPARKPSQPVVLVPQAQNIASWLERSLYHRDNPSPDEVQVEPKTIRALDNQNGVFRALATSLVKINQTVKRHTSPVRFRVDFTKEMVVPQSVSYLTYA